MTTQRSNVAEVHRMFADFHARCGAFATAVYESPEYAAAFARVEARIRAASAK